MSAPRRPKPAAARLVALASLAVVFGVLYFSVQGAPWVGAEVSVLGALGFLLLAGTLMADLLELLGLPHLTGYLAAGIVAGPHVMALIDLPTVKRLSPINTLALALIALAGGAELRLEQVRQGLRSLVVATILQSLLVGACVAGAFVAAKPIVPFARELTTGGLIAVAILWGVVATSRSPSATLGILAQTRARGRLTSFALAFVMTSDVVVILMLASGMAIARPLLDPGASLSLHEFAVLGHEIVAAISVGTTLGLLLAIYLRASGKHLVLVLAALGFGVSEVLSYLRFDPLLTFVVAGFVVQNLSRQGESFLRAIEGTGSVVYVLFFASAGADLDIPLLRTLWPLALLLAGVRALSTLGAARASSLLARDEPVLKRWGWTALVAQAGLTQGLAGIVEREYPSFGPQFRALVVANVALNAIIGPILFKLALDRSGESRGPAPALGEESAAGV